jgi:hypothetical protein
MPTLPCLHGGYGEALAGFLHGKAVKLGVVETREL